MKLLKNRTIKSQFNLIIASLIIVCSLLGFLVNLTVQNLLLQNKINYAQNTALKFESEINHLFKRINSISEYIQYEPALENLFINPFNDKTQSYFNDLHVKLTSLSIMNHDIADIALVNDAISWSSLFNKSDLQAFLHQLDGSPGLSSLGIVPPSFIAATAPSYLVFGRNIWCYNDPNYFGQKLGSVIISIDPAKSSIQLPHNKNVDTYFMLADQNLNLYPFNCIDSLAQSIFSTVTTQLPLLQENITHVPLQVDTPDYVMYISYIPSMSYYVISAIDKHSLFSDLGTTRILIALIILIVILFMWLLIKLLLSSVLTPINKLYVFIKSIREGNHKKLKQAIILEGCTEINTLGNEFNRMLLEINTLNHQLFDTTTSLYELEIEKNKAEIAHLRSQINPHFLYNTLESIRGIALEKEIPQIATMTVAMGKIFRYSIKGASTAPLLEELTIIKAYLDIQLVRFNCKFEVFYSIHPNTETLYVPKMILQPLIENAIFHGIEKKIDAGLLYIGSKITPDHALYITIQDDGVGMSSDTVETLLLNDGITSHIGILNVHNRIKLLYGDAYGLQIVSSEQLGTKITIVLPIISTEKRNNYAERTHS
ncbi:MAG: histidine kinase [Niameybacter sp.]|uniref:sensor histidine kinase n=1 Tax=Niameybacter sp. TaxID=2033640 RepID=UPI002FCC7C46